eukprot:230249-Amphidinium_carterae.2
MTTDRQWDKSVFENIEIPQMDTAMNKDYTKEQDIGKAIIDLYFIKTRHMQVQSGHQLWINNNKEKNNSHLSKTRFKPSSEQQATYTYIHPTANAMARQDNYKPPHRLTGTQPPPIVAQLDDILINKEITLENNEDKEEKN